MNALFVEVYSCAWRSQASYRNLSFPFWSINYQKDIILPHVRTSYWWFEQRKGTSCLSWSDLSVAIQASNISALLYIILQHYRPIPYEIFEEYETDREEKKKSALFFSNFSLSSLPLTATQSPSQRFSSAPLPPRSSSHSSGTGNCLDPHRTRATHLVLEFFCCVSLGAVWAVRLSSFSIRLRRSLRRCSLVPSQSVEVRHSVTERVRHIDTELSCRYFSSFLLIFLFILSYSHSVLQLPMRSWRVA